MRTSNSARIIQELVSLEAWYDRLAPDCDSPFHIAVAFSDARYSGTDRSPVQFRVRLKRAVLVVECDENLSVPRKSKVRQHPKRETQVTQTDEFGAADQDSIESRRTVGVKANACMTPSASAQVDASDTQSASQSRSEARSVAETETLTQNIEMTYLSVGEEHHWDLKPIRGDHLIGHAHDGESCLMHLRPGIDARLEDLGVRVYLRCKADDFDITDIEAKKSVIEHLGIDGTERRLKMAKEVIKAKLAEADLEVVELDPKFQDVILADIVAIPE